MSEPPTPCPEPSRDGDPVAPDGLLSPSLIARAGQRIGAALAPTPLLRSPARDAWLKLENLQITGAYKVRGALNAIAARVERGDRRPVFAASAGNHGLGVAWAARRFGLSATIVVPSGAPLAKVGGCRALGAAVIRGAPAADDPAGEFEGCVALARALARDAGGWFLHPFDDPEVIAGQATVALELAPGGLRPDVVVVPIGGGGLIAGMGSVLRRAGIRVVGAQVAGVDAFRRVLCGSVEPPARPRATLADGLRVKVPGALPLRIGAAVVDDIVVVEEEEVAAAIASLAATERIVAEGAGAVAVAALARVRGERRVAVVSGGNIDPDVLAVLLGECHIIETAFGASRG